MKNKLYTLIALLSFCTAIHAQMNTFNRHLIHIPSAAASDCNSIQQTTDQGYIISRSTADSFFSVPNNYYSEIIKADIAGDVVWAKQFSAGTAANTLMKSSTTVIEAIDGGYLLSFSEFDSNARPQICIVRLDGSGNILWSKKYMTYGSGSLYCLKSTTDNGYVACGMTTDTVSGNAYAFAMKIDQQGNLLWGNKSEISSSQYGAFMSIAEIPGQGYVFAGFAANHGLLMKTDNAGNVIWNKTFLNYTIYSVIYTSDFSLVMTGQYFIPSPYAKTFFLAKSDTTGALTWSKKLVPSSSQFYDAYGADVKEKNGAYYFVGYVSPPIPAEMMGSFTAAGNLVWCNQYTSFHPFNYTPATLDLTDDGGFVFTSMVGSTPGNFGTAFLKTDGGGNAGCDGSSYAMPVDTVAMNSTSNLITTACGTQVSYVPAVVNLTVNETVDCENIQNGVSVEEGSMQNAAAINVYPNPSDGMYTVQFINETPSDASVDVIDVLGQRVYNPQPMQNNVMQIDLRTLPDGVYFVRVRSGDNVTTTRLLKTQ